MGISAILACLNKYTKMLTYYARILILKKKCNIIKWITYVDKIATSILTQCRIYQSNLYDTHLVCKQLKSLILPDPLT